MYLIQKWQRNAPEPLFKGLTIINVDFVLNHTCASNLIPIQHKDVMEGQDKFSGGGCVSWSPIHMPLLFPGPLISWGLTPLGELARLTPSMSPLPLSSERWGCLTYSLLQLTPCCYSLSARYMGAKHASMAEEAMPHLAEPCNLSSALSHVSTFPLVRVWSYSQ